MAATSNDICDQMIGQEEEPGLGNAGLARLASCFMDSLALFEVPAVGYNIRYEFGIFGQAIRNGWQVEIMDKWLRGSNPGEIVRPQIHYEVKFGGHAEVSKDERGRYQVRWLPDTEVKGEAYDAPILGYRVGTSNIVRLSKAEAGESFDFAAFNEGDYYGAVADKREAENIAKVLFRSDEFLRLQRQYFFVSGSLQGMIWAHRALNRPVAAFREEWAVQLNNTHPAIALAEVMHLLTDEHGGTGIRRGTEASAGCSRASEARVVIQLFTLIERQGSLYRHCRKQGGNYDDDDWD